MPRMIVVKFASKAMPCAFRIGTIYGRMANIPENCINRNKIVIKRNGLSVRFLVISLILFQNVGGECVHFMADFSQFAQDADISLIFFSWFSSVEIVLLDTHPRSTCNDLFASSERCFESSQIGDSGI